MDEEAAEAEAVVRSGTFSWRSRGRTGMDFDWGREGGQGGNWRGMIVVGCMEWNG